MPGLFEVNEAFASVVLAWQRETGASTPCTQGAPAWPCRPCAKLAA